MLKPINRSSLILGFVVLVLALVGATSGLLIGNALTRKPTLLPPVRPASDFREIDSVYRFASGVGEQFPDEHLITSLGQSSTFASLNDGNPTVLLFWHIDCSVCIEQAQLWNTFVEPHLKKRVKQVVCLAQDTRGDIASFQRYFENKTTVFIDYPNFIERHNLVVSPTIISLDGSGIITHIQYEFSPFFDERLVDLVADIRDTD